MKTYPMERQFHAFLTAAVDGDESLA